LPAGKFTPLKDLALLELEFGDLPPQVSTSGLRISDSPTSDDLTPQETTNQDAPEMGADGGDLSCPGSSVVADDD
jgi:hypothetical protein